WSSDVCSSDLVPCLPQPPSLWLEHPPVLLVEFGEADRQLERDRRPLRQVLILEERCALLVGEGGAVELEGSAPPMRHGGVRRWHGRCDRPLRQEDRGRRVQPPEAAVREARPARSHGFADREVTMV